MADYLKEDKDLKRKIKMIIPRLLLGKLLLGAAMLHGT